MNKRRFSRTARVLMVLGVLLQAAAMVLLMGMNSILEYVVCAPDVHKMEAAENAQAQPQYETGLMSMAESVEQVQASLGDSVTALACAGWRSAMPISAGDNSAEATLVAVGKRYLETCPQRLERGRWMDGAELDSGARLALLDADLAFKLFGSEDCTDRLVQIEGEEYRVIGTVRHRRQLGETDAFRFYIPLSAADGQGLQLTTMVMYALPAVENGLDQSFQTLAASAWGEGSFYNLSKERMGALLLTRGIAFAFGMAVLFRLLELLRRWAACCWARIGQLRKRYYARRWLMPAVWRVLSVLLGAAALLAAVYGLLCLLIAPVYSFTEWVPESLVELSALEKVFWDRISSAAQLVRLNTPETARTAFWGGTARLGGVLLLLGLALGRKNEKKMRNMEENGNQSTPEIV